MNLAITTFCSTSTGSFYTSRTGAESTGNLAYNLRRMTLTPITQSLLVVAIGFAAGLLPLAFSWTHRQAHRWISFGAGVLLGAAFLHMIPEAFEVIGPRNFGWILAGFLLLYLVEQATFGHGHGEGEDESGFHEMGLLAFLGLGIHDFVDGLAIASGEHLPELTPVIMISLLLHKIPTTFSLALLLYHGGYSRRRIMMFLGLALAMIPLGVLSYDFVIGRIAAEAEVAVARMVLFSAGTFVYISVYELLPEMHRLSGRKEQIARFFMIGIGAMLLLAGLQTVV